MCILFFYAVCYVVLAAVTFQFGQNKSDLDSAIVIISLISLIFNNIGEDFPGFKSKMNYLSEKGFEFIYEMLITTGAFSLLMVSIIPFTQKIMDLRYFNSISINFSEYYSGKFFMFSFIYFLTLIIIGVILGILRNKFKEKNNIPYTSFWIFILILYIYSIVIFYNK